jgi:RHS repeat-associated protein
MYASILGESAAADDVIVRFSFAGDSDLNGFVEAADYGTIDNYSQFPGADGYQNGDFNYDGVIDGADYGIIDQTIQFQSQGRLEPHTRRLLYSDQWQVLEERLGGITDMQYVWSPRYVDAMVLRDRDTDGNGSLEERHYVEQDENFNVTSVTNASGVVQERFIYDPYGTVEVLNPDWTADTDGGDYGWQYLHQGGRYDAASGLYSFRHREYSTELGRWARQDPAGYVDGASLYQAYVSSPVTMVDADGLQHRSEGGGTVGSLSGGRAVGSATRTTGPTRAPTTGPTTAPTTLPTTWPSGGLDGRDFPRPTDPREWSLETKLANLQGEAMKWNQTSPPWSRNYQCDGQAQALDDYFRKSGIYDKLGIRTSTRIQGRDSKGNYHNVLVVVIPVNPRGHIQPEFIIDPFKSYDKNGKCKNPAFPDRNGNVLVMTRDQWEKQFPPAE